MTRTLQSHTKRIPCLLAASLLLASSSALADEIGPRERTLVVTATAYNSVPAQTDDEPNIAAWGDWLEPGMKAIAVSRDLMPLGLTRNVVVTIDGLPGTYVVLDKMGKRWTRKIDIYMGEDIAAARRWGKRKVRIRWPVPQPTIAMAE